MAINTDQRVSEKAPNPAPAVHTAKPHPHTRRIDCEASAGAAAEEHPVQPHTRSTQRPAVTGRTARYDCGEANTR